MPGPRLAAACLVLLLAVPAALAGADGSAPARALAIAEAVEADLVDVVRGVEGATVTVVSRHVQGRRLDRPMPIGGVGSGVVISWRGVWVLTNEHVVNGERHVEAVTPDGARHRLRVRALSRDLDLALLAFETVPASVTPVDLERIDATDGAVGSWVIASGNPFFLGLDGVPVVTLGVLSGTRPPDPLAYLDSPTLQHDAEINPGSSGGALWDASGRLIGINGTIATRSRQQGGGPAYTGASFAVPVRSVRAFLEEELPGPAAPGGASTAEPHPRGAAFAVGTRFGEAVRAVTPATVTVVPFGVPLERAGFSSGVIVGADGLVLSDSDAGLWWNVGPDGEEKIWRTDVEIRVPRAGDDAGYDTHRGRVLHRDREADTALIRMRAPPEGGLPRVPIGSSDLVQVGDFAFVLGTAFDEEGRAPATLTVGLIAAATPAASGGAGGLRDFLYTTAAANQGVNGGPLVDLTGRLVGTVSTSVAPDKDLPHQMLGKIVPIDRIRAAHAHVPGAAAALAAQPAVGAGESGADALQSVIGAAGRRARRALVSLEVRRARPVSPLSPLGAGDATLRRYEGPVSGLLVSEDGWIVTSLYNLTNVGSLVEPLWAAPPGAGLLEGLADMQGVTACFPDGLRVPARFVGHDRRLGIALLKADLPGSAGAHDAVFEVAPPTAFEVGRIVVTAGDPYGATGRVDPLLTAGILSRHHPDHAAAAWRGAWQTDAAGLDSNCGGAAVDLHGRLLGLLTLWHPARHGRNSGIAFVVPWARIEAALPALKQGSGPERGFLGVRFAPGPAPRLAEVYTGTAAARAGLRAGDQILSVDGHDVPTVSEAIAVIGYRCANERVSLSITRRGVVRTVETILGRREEPDAPR